MSTATSNECSSRFSHFHNINSSCDVDDQSMDTQDGNTIASNDSVVVKAGIRYQTPGKAVSFDSVVINGHANPYGTVATVIRPSPNGENGQEEVATYDNLKNGEHEFGVVGTVSFSKGGTGIENGLIEQWQGRSPDPVKFALLNPLQISVKYQANSKTSNFTVLRTTTVDELKQLIKAELDLNPQQQELIYAGKKLQCDKTLGEYGIQGGSKIDLTYRLRGG
ncbi:hypothetical protein BsWGS_08842 [Bradybaena similaris]